MLKLQTLRILLCLGLMGALTQCADVSQLSEESETRRFAATSKTDAWWTACEAEQVMAWLNRPDIETASLTDRGVNLRAAGNIIDYRCGADETIGTADDEYFDDLFELDGVPWVGPVSFQQLVGAVSSECERADGGSGQGVIEVIFSPQPYGQSHLTRAVELLDAARYSVDLAMYAFRDKKVLAAVERAHERGVQFRVILESARGDRSDPDGTVSAAIESFGIDVRYINKIMHHKFMLIDAYRPGQLTPQLGTLFTGSGNFSYSAGTRFDENTVVIEGNADLVGHFAAEFALMWDNSRDFSYNTDVPAFTSAEVVDVSDLIDDERIEAVFTSDNFTLKETHYGPTFSVNKELNTVADRLVELINEADESILVATGHLRSRSVSEALIQKRIDRPDMDIRVYLDAHEYISEWYHYHQVREREECLEEAGESESKRQDCMDRGFYYSYSAQESGVDVRFKHYAYRWHYSYAVQMHHKYLVVDGRYVAAGSYNLSDNAEHNTLENMVIYEIPEIVEQFTDNFESIWETGADDNRYEDLLREIKEGSDEIPLVYPSMALNWQEVKVLKDTIEELCPAVHRWDFKKYPQSHKTCPRE